MDKIVSVRRDCIRRSGRRACPRSRLWLLICILLLSATAFPQVRDLTRWVNPFIGTGGHGHTFPGATMPFGMVQLSPDTRVDNWDGSSGYHYSDDIIYGFSHTHLSGTGIPDGSDILFMPTVGTSYLFAQEGDRSVNGYASKFSHENEKAEPGYYSVKLDDDGTLVELTSTTRVGLHRYSFPDTTANIILDLKWRDKVLSSDVAWVSDGRIEGHRESSSWAKRQKIYFVAEFSKKIDAATSQIAPSALSKFVRPDRRARIGTMTSDASSYPMQLRGNLVSFQFKTSKDEKILIKVAISYVSIEGARKNLEAELPHWDFDRVRTEAKVAWNKELSKIEVSGGTDDQTTNFYTALYHTMIHPNVFNDMDGRYRGHDGKIHQLPGTPAPPLGVRRSSASPESTSSIGGSAAGSRPSRVSFEAGRKSGAFPHTEGRSPSDSWRRGDKSATTSPRLPVSSSPRQTQGDHYTTFSLWDTFRAAHPLYTIIDQKRTVDFINTFIRIYEQGGRLPVWELWGEETDTMIGYHAVSVIADAMAKGIKGFDYDKAYAAAKHSAELDHFGLAAYKRRGYISGEDENESVSKTLEYAYNDWCLMSMASTLFNRKSLGKGGSIDTDPYLKKLHTDVEHFKKRSGNYENLFDSETRFFRPRLNGGFIKPFSPQEVTFHFTEGNSWQYSFFVPHDVSGLMQLMGGETKFVDKLDELFTTEAKLSGREQPDITGLMGQYAHGNEPSHHIAYLYNYAGRPSKTQHRVRRIMDEFYKPTPDGLIGNEDCGQMSAWYVLSASGFYSVLPGQTRYDLGTPLFKRIVYHLENGKKFVVSAPKASASSYYIKSAKWNGAPHPFPYVLHEQIMEGGVLELEMTDKPNDKAFDHISTSSVFRDWLAVPVVESDARVFAGTTTVSIRSAARNAKIYYTLDSTEPTAASSTYAGPITINKTTTVKAFVTGSGAFRSNSVEARFDKRSNDWTVRIASPYGSQYPGGGEIAIIDGLRGNNNFASGEWQGYQGKVLEAVIDLQRETAISEVGGSFLQVARSWIWMPDRIEFATSIDGVTFTNVAEIKPAFPQQEMNPVMKEFRQTIKSTSTRFVRVRAFNFGTIPAWHVGAGGDPWIFVDEIFIK